MANIKLVLEYDGTHFNGWQLQPEQRTVQGTVEAALSRLTAEPIRVHCAGRTDSGVHALGQVVNFHCHRVWNPEIYVNGGNGLLPRDVRILSAEPVSDDFHSRYSARSRSYRYQISRRVCAVGRQYRWHVPYELDVQAMASAVSGLVGEHDFESFCQAGSGLHHFRCLVHQVDWQRQGDELIFEITANRFVHNMVRILVGTCVEFGRGRRHPQEMHAILQARDRRVAGPTAPAHGLLLTAVGY
ncbi:tRNA pseudouridine(38-40) synthase TruA [bacterium]|nr:tRNA pseudouridine(38-40) synthase TruA [bacterium]